MVWHSQPVTKTGKKCDNVDKNIKNNYIGNFI